MLQENEEEWILIFEIQLDPGEMSTEKISQGRQDQPDRQDKAAFGWRHLAEGEQNPVNPVNPV